MEVERPELDFDEFEMLLGEIPNATSGIPHSDAAAAKSASQNGGLPSISVNSYKGPLTEKLHSKGSLDELKLSISRTQGSSIKRVQPEVANLPDDQSLTSAFADLSFSAESDSATFTSSLKASSISSSMKGSPSFQSSNAMPCGFDEFSVKTVNGHEMKQIPAGYRHPRPIENFSTALPLAHGVPGFQFVSNVGVSGVEFPLMSDQRQYYRDVQSVLPCIHPQHLNQPHISWRNFDEEQYYRMMPQQYLYLQQQLRNQRLEAQRPVHGNGNAAAKLMNRNMRQPYFEVPISHQLQQSNQEQFWNNYAVTRGINQSHNGINILDKLGKQNFPEKILTRSQGLNTFKTVMFGSAGGNEPLVNLNQHGKVMSNGHHRHNLSTSSTGCFQLDHFSSWNLSDDISDHKSTNVRPQPQKYNSVDEVTGRVYLMAKDQHGCRFLQRKFSEGTAQDIEKIFVEVIDHIVELMTDPFGNYLVQKLLEVCNEDQRMQILCSITRKAAELVRISCDMHGTRAVQKVIETLKTPQQFSMVVSSLKPGLVTLIKDMNGNHVAQRCLQFLSPEYSEFLFEAATANCVELATDRHGCCVLQKCLSHSEAEQRSRLISEITSNALILSQDPFGNYVVQFIFELHLPWAICNILDQLEGNYGELSMQKYSSNVVEKCLKYASEERRANITKELISNVHLDQVMQDPYGNYVIQAALHQSKGALHAALIEAIRPHVPVLRTSPYGKKVLSSNCLKK
ncbi:pumilio homolog 12 [Mercurialis annua]|uniref:pumilio homolog 12 n=1 Tax=Mercurialis annua TaxID=3986 RepID=UPI00215F75F0|nr:pumilio homolog 12 [Mercurialis annua]